MYSKRARSFGEKSSHTAEQCHSGWKLKVESKTSSTLWCICQAKDVTKNMRNLVNVGHMIHLMIILILVEFIMYRSPKMVMPSSKKNLSITMVKTLDEHRLPHTTEQKKALHSYLAKYVGMHLVLVFQSSIKKRYIYIFQT